MEDIIIKESGFESAKDYWNSKSEEEKLNHCLQYALNAKQGVVLNIENNPELKEQVKEYYNLLREQIDWISIKLGYEPAPLYYGDGRNSVGNYFNIKEQK